MMWSLRLCAPVFLLVVAAARAEDRPASEKPYGLKQRIPWSDSRVVGSPDPPLPYKTVRAFPSLTVLRPAFLAPEPGTDRLFIISHLNHWAGPGKLLAVRDAQDAASTELVLDIDGLPYGLAFHPDYERNGFIFIGLRGKRTVQVLRYTVNRRSPHRADPGSKHLIIEWDSNGHDGGDLAFGNDGSLFISTGDGTSGSDPALTGQRIDDLQGSMLRIDVDHPEPGRNYGVPKDNPFVDRPGARPEVWAYGLRNPWRVSYDKKSGQLWVGNNGQDAWEQVYLIQKGGNYGWSLVEGGHVFIEGRQAGPDPILPPAADHPHSEARSMTGGRVYRGTRLPELDGVYVYGDWSTGHVWGVRHDGKKTTWQHELVDTPFNITGFGTDHAGELYIIDQTSGGFYRLERTSEADRPRQPFPTRLSETGLFASVAAHMPHPAAIRFDVNAPQWADGASMVRFAALPGLERVVQKPQLNAGGTWTLPNGSVLVQTLSLDRFDGAGKPARKRIETRLLVRQQGEWTGYSYRWNAAQTDAELVPAAGTGEELEVPDPSAPDGRREQTWRFPSPHRVPDLPHARRRIHPGLQPAPARSRSQLRRHRRQPAPRSNTSACSKAAARAGQDQAPAGQPIRCQGAAGGAGQVLRARQLLGLSRQRGRRQLPDGAGPRHPPRPDAPRQRGTGPRPPRHRRRESRRPRLARAVHPVSADLAPRDRQDAAPGI